MPEIIEAFEKDAHYFAVIEIEIEKRKRRFQFGVGRPSYLALRQILQHRPFDLMPGLKYRYFYAGSRRKLNDVEHEISVRVEHDRDSTQMQFQIPYELNANLLWFDQLRSFEEA